jgi:hypothetical protein
MHGLEGALIDMTARLAAEEDVAPGYSPCMTIRWFAAADGTLT